MEMFITIMGYMLVFSAIFLVVVVGAALVGIPKKAKAPANGNAFLFDHIYPMSLMVSGVVFMTRLFFGVGFALCAVIGFVFGLVVERVLWLVVPSRTANRWIAKSLADSKKLKSSTKASTQQPKCSLCRRTSDMVAADAKRKNPGVFVVGN
jgi:energy-converting hydrogenase Eha subunit A